MNKKYNWTWNLGHDGLISPEEMQNPEILLNSCEIVQNRPDSVVFKRNGIFFKWYKYNFKHAWRRMRYRYKSRAAREYRQMKLCQNAGLPTCDVLGYGQCGDTDSIIITREVCNCQILTDVIRNKFLQHDFNDDEFFQRLGEFLRKCFHCGIYFPDLHTSNIMYLPEKREFILIDMYGARRMYFFSKRKYIRMCHSLLYRIMPYITVERFYLLMQYFGKCSTLNDFIKFFIAQQKWLNNLYHRH